MSSKLPTIYLAGGMENVEALGAGWRETITPKLETLGYEVLNPCNFEPQQLKGLHTNRLPESIEMEDGSLFFPKHWHDLKKAPRKSSFYKRFQNYMRRIIRYDVDIVANQSDVVVCNWTKGTAKGAGTHSELTVAFMNHVDVYVRLEPGVDLPGWAHGCAKHIFDNFDDLLETLAEEG